MKRIIVAVDRHNGIGANNDLLWMRDVPADLEHFRSTTAGQTVIMGRKTYESIGSPLPNRLNIVVTSQDMAINGVKVVHSLKDAYTAAEDNAYIIGGGAIYAEAIDDMDELIVSEIDASFPQATVFFPEIGPQWQETSREHHDADARNKYAFDIVRYQRV